MTLAIFLRCVQQNAARVHGYKLGCDGANGLCDCIGLVIGAVRLGGEKWPWTHGSNYAARFLTRSLSRVSSISQLRLGELVFKARAPGDKGYALPARYQSSPDRLDYYHVGVVTSLNPLVITHCTTVAGGIKRDGSLGQWRYAGMLRLLTDAPDNKEEKPMYQAKVIAENGQPVRVRAQPAAGAQVICSLPVGTLVSAAAPENGWSQIQYAQGQNSYMMSKFLQPCAQEEAGGSVTLTLPREAAQALLRALEEGL